MNALWDNAVNLLLRGELDLQDDPLVIAPYAWFVYDGSQTILADLPMPLASGVPLDNRSVNERTLYADDVTFPVIASDVVIERLVVSRSTDGILVLFIDTRPDRMSLYMVGNGGPVEVVWHERAVMSL